jgi:hypothetical protein
VPGVHLKNSEKQHDFPSLRKGDTFPGKHTKTYFSLLEVLTAEHLSPQNPSYPLWISSAT